MHQSTSGGSREPPRTCAPQKSPQSAGVSLQALFGDRKCVDLPNPAPDSVARSTVAKGRLPE